MKLFLAAISVATIGLFAATSTFHTPIVAPEGVTGPLSVYGVLSSTNFNRFNPSKTYIAVFGNSIAVATPTSWSSRITNDWPGLAFYTNYAVGGTTHVTSTNFYYSNALSVLPPLAINGTNVLIVAYDALLTFNTGAWTTTDEAISAYTAWSVDCHSRGFKFIMPTTMPANYWPTEAQLPTFIQLNNWLLRSSNIVDFTPDFASVIPDCYDTNFISDGVHATVLGDLRLAKEWDAVVRLGEVRLPASTVQVGTNWVFAKPRDGSISLLVRQSGALSKVRAGGFNPNYQSSGNPIVAGGVSGGEASIIAHGAFGQANSNPVLSVGSYDSASEFRVFPDGSLVTAGGVVSGGGTFSFSSAGAGDNFLQLANIASNGRTYYIGSRTDGSFRIKDNTASVDRLTIDTNGVLTASSFASGSIQGITTTWTNMIPNVITQRISTIGGIVVTNLTI